MNFKFIFISLLIVCTNSLTAQKAKQASVEELNASKIIRFSNSVINLANSYQESLKNYKSSISTAENNFNKIKRNPNTTPFFVNCNVLSVQEQQKQEYATALKLVPVFDEKSETKKYVDEGEANIKTAGKWCTSLSNYFSNKEFTSDVDNTNYTTMVDSLTHYLKQTSISWAKAGELASNAGDKAELVLLKKSKIASFVIPMKEDLISLDKAFSMLKNEDIDTERLKENLVRLNESIEKNKDINTKDVSKLSDYYYREVYTTYYKQLSSTVSALDKLADKLSAKDVDNERLNDDYRYASSLYSSVVEAYNTFIKQ